MAKKEEKKKEEKKVEKVEVKIPKGFDPDLPLSKQREFI
jgi:hypothetical protein